MKAILNSIKEIGVVFSYICMLVACYLFDWGAFGLFISYLIEIVVLLFIYAVLRNQDERKNPEKYRKTQPIRNVFISVIPLVLFQYFLIGWMSSFINPRQNFLAENMLLTKEVFFAASSMVVLYSIKAIQLKDHHERIRVFQDNFLFKCLALTGANMIGFLLVLGFGVKLLLPVLTVMVIIRILLERYFVRKMKLI